MFLPVNSITSEAATIFGGGMSLIGGAAGATGAYFIAKMQMTKQLELQYKKEEEKMIKEIKINNYLKVLEIGDTLLQSIGKLHRQFADSTVRIIWSDNNSFIENDQAIRSQLQEVKELSTKLQIYKVFYEKNVSFHFRNLSNNINEMEMELLDTWLNIINEYKVKTVDSEEEFHDVYNDLSRKYGAIINNSKDDIIKLLSITQLNLAKNTNQFGGKN